MRRGFRQLSPAETCAAVGFDPLNSLLMSLVADEIRTRGVQTLLEISVPARCQMAKIYSILGGAVPEAVAAAERRGEPREQPPGGGGETCCRTQFDRTGTVPGHSEHPKRTEDWKWPTSLRNPTFGKRPRYPRTSREYHQPRASSWDWRWRWTLRSGGADSPRFAPFQAVRVGPRT